MNTQKAFAHIVELSKGFEAAQILFTALRFDLFTVLAEKEMEAAELALALQANERGVRILCDALTALGIILKAEGRYRNHPEYAALLSRRSGSHYLGMLHHRACLYERWRGLFQAVKSGTAPAFEPADPYFRPSAEAFAHAMKDAARDMADRSVAMLDLSSARSLLDVGGGPGEYAMQFARAFPEMQVEILDQAETLEVARANLEREGMQSKVALFPGDIFHTRPERRYDVVFSSNLIHSYASQENETLVANYAALLNPGGMLVIKDMILDFHRTSPSGPALFAINMLVNTPGGDCYTAPQVEEWFVKAGLGNLEWIEIDEGNRMLVGRKPS